MSGIRSQIVEMLVSFLNRRVHPVVPARGSLGVSGDLAPLAHVALVLIGEGEVFYRGQRVEASAAVKSAGIKPLSLEAKQGLALLNGTEVMAGVGALALDRAIRVVRLFDLAGETGEDVHQALPYVQDRRASAEKV